jgi:hypothetical protein
MKNKKEFVQWLIEEAQKNIWKNELAIEYKKQEIGTSNLDIEATLDIIKRDTQYVEFLTEELKKCE